MKLDQLDSRDNIGLVLNAMGLTGVGAEIGVAFGENAEQILLKSNLSRLLLVDPWNYVPNQNPTGYADAIKDWQGCYDYCCNKLARFNHRTTYFRMSSEEASKQIIDGSLDFVYIDANHMSPFIDEDLRYWYPKVKSGGVFGGHDYHDFKNEVYTCDVKTAVDCYIDESTNIYVVPGQTPSWYIIKP